MDPEDESIAYQAAWALGNIAGVDIVDRDLVLSHGVLPKLMQLLCPIQEERPTEEQSEIPTDLILKRQIVWTLGNLCRGKPCPEWKYRQIAIKALSITLRSADEEVLQDSAWALSSLCDVKDPQQIPAIQASGSLELLVDLLSHESGHVVHPAIHAIGNVLIRDQYDEHVIQYLINLGLLRILCPLITSENATIKREALRTISGMTSGSKEHIEAVISHDLFQPLINILKTEKYEISKEALQAICNAMTGGSEQQIAFLVHQGVLPALCQFLKNVNNKKILMVALEGMENVLKVGKAKAAHHQSERNQFAEYVEESGGVDYLEQLQSNNLLPDEINEKAAGLIKEYILVTLADFIRWMGSAPRQGKLHGMEELVDFDLVHWVLSMEQSMKVMLSGYGRFQCKIENDIPDDLLRMIMRFLTGSTLDEYLNQEILTSTSESCESSE